MRLFTGGLKKVLADLDFIYLLDRLVGVHDYADVAFFVHQSLPALKPLLEV